MLVTTRDAGAWLSTDGGDSWRPTGGPTGATVVAFGAEAALLAGDADGSVHRSVDDGASWTESPATPGAAVTALAAGGDEVVYAGDDRGRVARSDDDGRTFGPPADGLPAEAVASIARSPEHAADDTVWASLAGSGPHRSTDRGRTWEPVLDGITTSDQADETGASQFQDVVAGSGPDGPVVFLSGFDGLFRSDDGARWASAETLADRIVGIAVSPTFAADGTVAVATYLKGAYLSTDAGETWRPINDGLEYPLSDGNRLAPVRRLLGITFSPAYQRDRAIFSTTWPGFLTWRPGSGWTEVLVGQDPASDDVVLQQFVTAVHPDGTIDLGSRWGEVHRSTDGGRSWSVVAQVGGEVQSILIDPTTNDVWVATSSDVHRSAGGTGPFEPTGLGTGSVAAGWFDGPDSAVFAGTAEGLFVTRDRGATWEPVPLGAGQPALVEAVGVSPAFGDDGLVLVSVRAEGLFRSTDGGSTFAPAAPELLAANHLVGDFSNGVAAPFQFSPRFGDDGTVFAYSDRVVLRSTDAGASWEAFELPGMFELLAREAPGQLDVVVTPPGFEPPAGAEAGATGSWAAAVALGGLVLFAVAGWRVSRRTRPG